MIAARKINAVPMAAARPVLRRSVIARAAESTPESEPTDPDAVREFDAEEKVDPTISPYTGNPQTGKLIDVYFEVGSILVVVALSFWSMWNAKDVINQTSMANSIREPATKTEWLAMDNKDVYGPCGGSQGSSAAMEDLIEGKACEPTEYARAAPASQKK